MIKSPLKEYYKHILIKVRKNIEEAWQPEGLMREDIQNIVATTLSTETHRMCTEVISGKIMDEAKSLTPLEVAVDELYHKRPKNFKQNLGNLAKSVAREFPDNLICAEICNNLIEVQETRLEMGTNIRIGKVLNFLCFEGFRTRREAQNALSDEVLLFIDFEPQKLSKKERNELYSFLLKKREDLLKAKFSDLVPNSRYALESARYFKETAELVQRDMDEKLMKRYEDLMNEIENPIERN